MSKIAVIGHGNVGSHLARVMDEDHEVTIFTRNPKNKEVSLALLIAGKYDFIFLTVPDSAIKSVSEKLAAHETIVVHVSGSRPLSDLKKHKKKGVFYPLQTFSKEKEVDFEKVRIFVEGTVETENRIVALAKSISKNVDVLSSAKRAKLHLAAVFACNFGNHMFHIAESQLNEIGMKFQDISLLITEMVEKAIALHPSNAQTGPAIRNDKVTIGHHLEALDEDEKRIYEIITENIQKYH